MNNSDKTTLSISRLSAFQDNYLWLIDNGEKAIAIERSICFQVNKLISPNTAALAISKNTAIGFSKNVSRCSGGICSAPKNTPDKKNAALRIKSMICFVSLMRT